MIMVGNKKRWQQAQAEELECWSYNQERVSDPRYMAKKREYWQQMLHRVGFQEEILHDGGQKILEVGCGPTGIFILLDAIADNYTILDPLLDEYQKLYTHPFYPAHSISLPLEDLRIDKNTSRFDRVFAINCVDHVRDLRLFLERLSDVSSREGTIYLAVNTHERKSTARIWRWLQWVLEPHHPYHFTKEEYEEIFAEYLDIEKVIDIEDDIIWIHQTTQEIGHIGNQVLAWRRFIGKLHPVRLFFGVLEWLGLPAHDFSGTGASIYRHQMFVMRPRKQEHVS